MTDITSYTPAGFSFATQIVTNAQNPQGERIFIDASGTIVARVALVQGTAYGVICAAVMDAFYAAGSTIWDRDDKMDFYRAIRGRVFPAQ